MRDRSDHAVLHHGYGQREAVAGLRMAVADGTGFAGWHGGIADSFRNTSDYLHWSVDSSPATRPEPHERTGDRRATTTTTT